MKGKLLEITLDDKVIASVDGGSLQEYGDEESFNNFMQQKMLPHWATDFAYGEVQIGAQLPTRDGRRAGNAHVIDKGEIDCLGTTLHFWVVLTDAGNAMELTDGEIAEMFYPPEYVSDVGRVIDKFAKTGDV